MLRAGVGTGMNASETMAAFAANRDLIQPETGDSAMPGIFGEPAAMSGLTAYRMPVDLGHALPNGIFDLSPASPRTRDAQAPQTPDKVRTQAQRAADAKAKPAAAQSRGTRGR